MSEQGGRTPQATADRPPVAGRAAPRRTVAVVAVPLLVAAIGVVAVGVHQRRTDDEHARAVAEVETAFRQGDCTAVSRAVRRVQAFDDAESTVHVSVRAGDCADDAALQAVEGGSVRDHVRAFAAYATPRRGLLVEAAAARLARRLRGTEGSALADVTSCGVPEQMVEALLMTGPAGAELAAGFLTACGDLARDRSGRGAAIAIYRRVVQTFPLTRSRDRAERAWAGELLSAASGEVDGELRAPGVVGRDTTLKGAARLVIYNESPGAVTVALTGRRPVVAEAEDCAWCEMFPSRSAAGCQTGRVRAVPVLVPAGTVTSLLAQPDTGRVTARGRWRLEAGVVYSVCFFTFSTDGER